MTTQTVYRFRCDVPHCTMEVLAESLKDVPDGWLTIKSTDHIPVPPRQPAYTGRQRTSRLSYSEQCRGSFTLHLCPDDWDAFEKHLPRTDGAYTRPGRDGQAYVSCSCGMPPVLSGEPGTFDVNPHGDATQPGGVCLCSRCVIDDPCGGKARFAPNAPDACQHCHQREEGHDDDVHLKWHQYTAPTEQQRAGRQAAIDEFQQDDDPDEAMCDALYPEEVRGYLGRPRCMSFADHRDAADPKFHDDARGFRWPRKAA